MVQEDISLNYFMAFDVKSIHLQAPDSIVVEFLPVGDDKPVLIRAADQVVREDTLQQAAERKPGRLGESFAVVSSILVFAVAGFEDGRQVGVITFQTGDAEPL